MSSPLRVVKTILIIPTALLVLSFIMSLYMSAGTGTFHADYYYLPLRDFVAAPQRGAMETKVIELWNAQQTRSAIFALIRDGVCIVCLLAARVVLTQAETTTGKANGRNSPAAT